MPTKDPNYDYERNADRTVTLRLMKVYGHYYNLLFTTEDRPSDRSFIPPHTRASTGISPGPYPVNSLASI